MTADSYLQYVEALDAAPVEVSRWEAEFLESLLAQKPATFSPKQIAILERMVKQYLGEII
jgi:hypothetical protein